MDNATVHEIKGRVGAKIAAANFTEVSNIARGVEEVAKVLGIIEEARLSKVDGIGERVRGISVEELCLLTRTAVRRQASLIEELRSELQIEERDPSDF